MNMKKMWKSPMVMFLVGAGVVYALGKYKVLPMSDRDLVRLD